MERAKRGIGDGAPGTDNATLRPYVLQSTSHSSNVQVSIRGALYLHTFVACQGCSPSTRSSPRIPGSATGTIPAPSEFLVSGRRPAEKSPSACCIHPPSAMHALQKFRYHRRPFLTLRHRSHRLTEDFLRVVVSRESPTPRDDMKVLQLVIRHTSPTP